MGDKKQAEAYVNGILRGGYLIGGLFCFHSGSGYHETRHYSELIILEDENNE